MTNILNGASRVRDNDRPFNARKALRQLVAVGLRNEVNRIDWVRQTLQRVPAHARILDAGCGEQQYRKFCSHLVYIGQDFAKFDGLGDDRGLQRHMERPALDITSDIASIPEPDGSFDAILCTEVFEHIPDPIAALREFSRLLKPGGQLILTAPFCSLSHYTPYHFCTGFNRYWYEHHLGEFGFAGLEVTENGNYFEFIAQELWRIPAVVKKARMPAGCRLVANALAVFALPLLGALGFLSWRGQKSADLLCFGYHVFARRVRKSEDGLAKEDGSAE